MATKRKDHGFMLKQRAFLKLYLYRTITQHKSYGRDYLKQMQEEFKEYGFHPSHVEIYKTLHEMTLDGYVKREKRIKGDPATDFQEIILYTITDAGKENYEAYSKSMKVELERCRSILDKAIRDNYGPVK